MIAQRKGKLVWSQTQMEIFYNFLNFFSSLCGISILVRLSYSNTEHKMINTT